jgi:hypothetical protein
VGPAGAHPDPGQLGEFAQLVRRGDRTSIVAAPYAQITDHLARGCLACRSDLCLLLLEWAHDAP